MPFSVFGKPSACEAVFPKDFMFQFASKYVNLTGVVPRESSPPSISKFPNCWAQRHAAANADRMADIFFFIVLFLKTMDFFKF